MWNKLFFAGIFIISSSWVTASKAMVTFIIPTNMQPRDWTPRNNQRPPTPEEKEKTKTLRTSRKNQRKAEFAALEDSSANIATQNLGPDSEKKIDNFRIICSLLFEPSTLCVNFAHQLQKIPKNSHGYVTILINLANLCLSELNNDTKAFSYYNRALQNPALSLRQKQRILTELGNLHQKKSQETLDIQKKSYYCQKALDAFADAKNYARQMPDDPALVKLEIKIGKLFIQPTPTSPSNQFTTNKQSTLTKKFSTLWNNPQIACDCFNRAIKISNGDISDRISALLYLCAVYIGLFRDSESQNIGLLHAPEKIAPFIKLISQDKQLQPTEKERALEALGDFYLEKMQNYQHACLCYTEALKMNSLDQTHRNTVFKKLIGIYAGEKCLHNLSKAFDYLEQYINETRQDFSKTIQTLNQSAKQDPDKTNTYFAQKISTPGITQADKEQFYIEYADFYYHRHRPEQARIYYSIALTNFHGINPFRRIDTWIKYARICADDPTIKTSHKKSSSFHFLDASDVNCSCSICSSYDAALEETYSPGLLIFTLNKERTIPAEKHPEIHSAFAHIYADQLHDPKQAHQCYQSIIDDRQATAEQKNTAKNDLQQLNQPKKSTLSILLNSVANALLATSPIPIIPSYSTIVQPLPEPPRSPSMHAAKESQENQEKLDDVPLETAPLQRFTTYEEDDNSGITQYIPTIPSLISVENSNNLISTR